LYTRESAPTTTRSSVAARSILEDQSHIHDGARGRRTTEKWDYAVARTTIEGDGKAVAGIDQEEAEAGWITP
jgi:hypothetical protein